MHSRVYQEFEQIVSRRAPPSLLKSVLEVGSLPNESSLLCMEALKGSKEKIGINLDAPSEYRDFKIVQGNANAMEFPDNSFALVLCNALLEHDKFFWKTVAEIKRVTKPGGLIVIGTPGYKYLRGERFKETLKKIPLVRELQARQYLDFLFTGTLTFEVHNFPGDYYRFSEQTYKDVFFEGMTQVEIGSIMLPPRIVGSGIKPLFLA